MAFRLQVTLLVTTIISFDSAMAAPMVLTTSPNATAKESSTSGAFQQFVQSGNAELRRNKPQLAITHFTQALKLHPNDAYARKCLAYALLAAGYATQGAQQMEFANNLSTPSVEDHCFVGRAYAQAGDYKKAIHHLQLAVALDRQNPLPLVLLAETQKKAGLIKEARASAAQAMSLALDSELKRRALNVLVEEKPQAPEPERAPQQGTQAESSPG